ncbi:nitrate- and nitrite sensing domain-containing protein [Streptomyces sp. NPDC048248]|uniref:sensor histidine kinase n=1 Tax=Streptomyces sp. NPDC048248 TaxID=3365523 RepID=UPI0037145B91
MPRSVRAKIVALLMVPVVSLIALWAFATVTTAQNVSELDRLQQIDATLVSPVGDFVAAVQEERSTAARAQAAPDAGRRQALRDRQRATDAAASALRDGVNASSADAEAIDPALPGRIDRLMDDADGLTALREHDEAGEEATDRTIRSYTEVVDHGLATVGALSGLEKTAVVSEVRVVLELARAREEISREDAILGAAQAAGRMSSTRLDAFAGAVHTQRTLFAAAVDDLRPHDAAAYRHVLNGAGYRELHSAENAVRDAGAGTPAALAVPAAHWTQANDAVLRELRAAQKGATTGAARDADPLSLETLGGSGIAVVMGLGGVLLSLLISVKIGRRLVVELEDLRNSALRVAGRDLPESMRRLHAGKAVDIDAVAPRGERGTGRDEVGQVGEALVAVHRAALEAAADRAAALSGISGVYVSLARRSQLLLHRQLALLDTMERRTEDPAELEDLFRLDHLTTRMRRHAESLIILSGAAPGRGWRHPVPLLDVVRAAVAEVEDFPRVQVHTVAETRLVGGAVADLTHLLAELVENAVMFSPPHTKVQVRAERVGSGIAVEIQDRGLGMGKEALDEANRRIQDADEIDLLDTEQLGLFVVNRLAHRQHVRVTLQASGYGGVTAVVLLPEALLSGGTGGEPSTAEGESAAQEPVSLRHRRHPGAGRALASLPRHPRALPTAPAPHTGPDASPREQPPGHRNPDDPAPGDAMPEQPLPLRANAPAPAGEGAPEADPASAPSAAADAPDTGQAPPPAEADGALPRRVRQANLAPALRTSPQEHPEWVPRTEGTPAPRRSPEQARATMASLRAGWARGRDATTPPRPSGQPPQAEQAPPPGAAHPHAQEPSRPQPPRHPQNAGRPNGANDDPSRGEETR